MSESNGNGRLRISTPTLIQVAIWIVTVTLAYGALSERITTLEVKYDRLVQDVAEIKADVKQLLKRP